MWKYYRPSAVYLVFLFDLLHEILTWGDSKGANAVDVQSSGFSMYSSLLHMMVMENFDNVLGLILQELLAPGTVVFFNVKWNHVGNRLKLADEI